MVFIRTMNHKITLLFAIITFATNTFAQFVITGKVLDQETLTPIQNVNISVEDQSSGTTTLSDGTFILDIQKDKVYLILTSIGYKQNSFNVNISKGEINLGNLTMQPQPYSIDEITVNAGLSNDEELPVSISSISARDIETKLGDRPLPLVMQNTPGVFSIRNGGGSGDSKLTIRGFQQENVSLLLNGIPINGEENGLVYWSNWLGLSSAAAEIQIQKGSGLANASIYSIGGSVNIITRNVKKQRSGSINFEVTSYGNISTSVALNSGEMNNGWNTSLMLSIGSGKGYVDATYVSSFSYFFTAQKKINDQHNLTINLIAAPPRHGQRTLRLTSN